MKMMPTVGDYMKMTPLNFGPKTSLQTALGKMRKIHCKDAPVVKDGKVIGVLSDSHLSFFLLFSDEFGLNVEDAMTPDPIVCAYKTPLDEAISDMASQHKEVVVVQEERGLIIGTFNISDALKLLHDLLHTVYIEDKLESEDSPRPHSPHDQPRILM